MGSGTDGCGALNRSIQRVEVGCGAPHLSLTGVLMRLLSPIPDPYPLSLSLSPYPYPLSPIPKSPIADPTELTLFRARVRRVKAASTLTKVVGIRSQGPSGESSSVTVYTDQIGLQTRPNMWEAKPPSSLD